MITILMIYDICDYYNTMYMYIHMCIYIYSNIYMTTIHIYSNRMYYIYIHIYTHVSIELFKRKLSYYS